MSAGLPAEAARGRQWRTFGEYLAVLAASPLGVNVAAFVGHGTVHRAVLGDALHAGEPDDIARMKRLVEEALDEGAAGFSSGLEYWPGILSSPEHLVPLCEAAAQRDAHARARLLLRVTQEGVRIRRNGHALSRHELRGAAGDAGAVRVRQRAAHAQPRKRLCLIRHRHARGGHPAGARRAAGGAAPRALLLR